MSRIVRGLGSLLLTLILLVGVPAALWVVAGSLIPTSVPTWAALTDTLNRPDAAQLLILGAIKVVAWIAWATFAVALLVELVAQLRGVRAPHLRLIGAQQHAAAGLVAAILLLGPGATSLIHPSTAAAAVPAMSTPTVASAPAAVPAAELTVAPTPAAATTVATVPYVVRSGDSLWRIAEAQLGDGARYTEIAALNYGLPQPDGRTLTDAHWIDPGWTLLIPAPAAATPAENVPTAAAPTHVVEPGESLWDIAAEQLGDGARYPEIAAASSNIDQGGGVHLTDPNLIHPGWTVAVPTAATESTVDTAAVPPAPAPEQPALVTPPMEEAPPAVVAPVQEAPPAAPAPVQEALPTAEAPAAPSAGVPTPAASDSTQSSAVEAPDEGVADAERVDVRTAGGIGGLLAVGIIGLLTAKRLTARRRRRPGERIAMPDVESGESVLEAQMRAVADPLGVDTVNRALRAMAAWHRQSDRPLPDLRAARVSEAVLEIYLAEPADLPAPWTSTADRTVWQISDQDVAVIELDPQDDISAPYPSLVTLGHDEDDAHFLLDLEQLDCLSIRGDQPTTHATLAALAVELATSPWADDLQVTLVSTMPELGDVVDTGRIRHVHGLASVLRELEARALEVEQTLTHDGAASLSEARGRGLAVDSWTPEILLIGEQLDPAARAALDALVARVPRVGIAAVTSDDQIGEWVLDLDTDDPTQGVLQPAGLTIRPQQLNPEGYRRLLDLLRELEPTPGPSWGANLEDSEPTLAELPEGTDTDDASDETSTTGDDTAEIEEQALPTAPAARVIKLRPPVVKVLGIVEVDVASGINLPSSHRDQATELLAYVALHPGPSGAAISAALWPNALPNPSTRVSAISRARRWLGADAEGNDHLPRYYGPDDADTAGYRLRGVATDWQMFLALVGDDASITPLADLKAALSLVRGAPFGEEPKPTSRRRHGPRYVWAERLRADMQAAVVDVAHEVARRALQTGDATAARDASYIGRLVDPSDERVWRDSFRAAWTSGHIDDLNRLVDQFLILVDDLETDPEPETEELLDEVQRLTERRAAHGGTR